MSKNNQYRDTLQIYVTCCGERHPIIIRACGPVTLCAHRGKAGHRSLRLMRELGEETPGCLAFIQEWADLISNHPSSSGRISGAAEYGQYIVGIAQQRSLLRIGIEQQFRKPKPQMNPEGQTEAQRQEQATSRLRSKANLLVAKAREAMVLRNGPDETDVYLNITYRAAWQFSDIQASGYLIGDNRYYLTDREKTAWHSHPKTGKSYSKTSKIKVSTLSARIRLAPSWIGLATAKAGTVEGHLVLTKTREVGPDMWQVVALRQRKDHTFEAAPAYIARMGPGEAFDTLRWI